MSSIMQIYGIKEYHGIIKLLRFVIFTVNMKINNLVGIFQDNSILLRLMGLIGPHYLFE